VEVFLHKGGPMNIFKQFYKSIYSPKDIASFRFQGIGKAILFVFLLTLISILPSIFFLGTAITDGIDSAKSVIQHQLPPFSIKNGQLNAEANAPVTINNKNFTIVLDPTGAVTANKLDGTDNTFAILKNEFVFIAGGNTETYDYSMLSDIQITSKDFLQFLNTLNNLKMILIPGLSLFLYLFSSAANFFEISILALFGLTLVNLSGRRLNYRQLWIMTAYSETLATLFFTIMSALKTTVPGGFLLNWFVVMTVLYLAINETPKPKKLT
jgi:hypothetical protein